VSADARRGRRSSSKGGGVLTKASKPIGASRIVQYHYEHATQEQSAYYTEGGVVVGQFHGKLAEEFGLLDKPATEEIIKRLAEGQHPWTGEQLVQHRRLADTPIWEKQKSAWAERLEAQMARAVEDGANPFTPARMPGRSKGPERIVEEPRTLSTPEYDEHQKELLAIHEDAARFYSGNLAGSDGAAYLEKRGITPASAEEFRLGFSGDDNGLVKHLASRYSRALLLTSGLVYESRRDGAMQDRFRNRVMFPIEDGAGNVVAFSGRRIDNNKDRKYINSSNTPIYQKSESLYNAHRAALATEGRLMVVEGPMDAIQAHQAGHRKVAGLLGTALNAERITKVSKYVLLNLDGDEAGRSATEKYIGRLLDAGADVKAISLEDDPDKFIRRNGSAAFVARVSPPEPLVGWLGERARERWGSGDTQTRVAGYRWMLEVLSHAPSGQRAGFDEELRRHLGLTPDEAAKKKYTEHRAAIDVMFAPPKTMSVEALVGGEWNGQHVPGDQRIVEAHKKAVIVALDRLQTLAQARFRDSRETTENWCVVTFLHDVARPVGGQAPNPQLHTHAVVFNMTRSSEGIRSMDPEWIYRAQGYANAVYMAEMANALRGMGYELERGKNFGMEIKGYSKEYLAAVSLRSEEIEQEKTRRGATGAEAGEIIAVNLRQPKQKWDVEELKTEHRRQAEAFGQNPAELEAAARERGTYRFTAEQRANLANEALYYAKARLFHGQTVNEKFELVRDALRYRPDLLRVADVETAFERRKQEFLIVDHYRIDAPGERYTTPEMKTLERESIREVLKGQGRTTPIVEGLTREEFREAYKTRIVNGREITLNNSQMWMAYKTLTSRNQYVIVAGSAGVGKSTSFEPVCEIAERHREAGYRVVGLAATSSATNNLRSMGVPASTLQLHNIRPVKPGTPKTLYLLDEGSLVGAPSFRKFVGSIRPQDRVVIAYDRRQHTSVEAGRVIEELETSGVDTIRLEKIVRQRENPELLAVIEKFRESFGHRGSLRMIEGLQMLDDQRRIWQAPNRPRRFDAIAEYYAYDPEDTVVVTPDNRSLEEINQAVRAKLQTKGMVQADACETVVLKGVRGLTDADKRLATNYEPGNVIRWGKAGTLGGRGRVVSGQYTTVLSVDADRNEITIRVADSLGQHDISFDPRSGQGEVYDSDVRAFAVGDKVRITRPWTIRRGDVVANGAVGTIRELTEDGKAQIEIDGRLVDWDMQAMPHAEYGYAMTSYTAQSLTVSRVAVHIDTGDSRIRSLIEKSLLYVGASRAASDVMVFTDDREVLLSPEESPILRQQDKPMALSSKEIEEEAQQAREVTISFS
jgi:DNA primase catalytic core